MSCIFSSYGSSLPSIQSLPSSGRASCLTLTYYKSPKICCYQTHSFKPARAADFASCSFTRDVSVAAAKYDESYGYVGMDRILAKFYEAAYKSMGTASDPGVDFLDEFKEDMASEKESYGCDDRDGACGDDDLDKGCCTPNPCPLQGKLALYSQQSEYGKIVGNTITAGMPTFYHTTTFFNSPSCHLKTLPPLSFSSFLTSSSPTLKPLPAAFRAVSPAISFTRRARVVTSSATKSSSTSTLGDTSVSSEEKIYLVFHDAATLTNFLAKISEDGLVMTEITYHPRTDTLDEASGKKGKAWEIVPSDKMYEKCQTGEPDGRILETLVPGYYGPVYAIISITGVFMIATTMPLTMALILVEKHAQILVEKQLCNSQIVKLCAIESGDSLNQLADAQDARLPVEIKKELAIESGGSSNRFAGAPHPVKIMNEHANDSGDSLNRFTDAQVSLLPVDNHETRGEMVRVINFTSIKYGLIGHLNQHPVSSVGEPLVSSVAEPLIRATDSVGKWGQISPVAAVIFAASVILSKILG